MNTALLKYLSNAVEYISIRFEVESVVWTLTVPIQHYFFLFQPFCYRFSEFSEISHLLLQYFSIQRSSWLTRYNLNHHPSTTVLGSCYEVFVPMLCSISTNLAKDFCFSLICSKDIIPET